MRIPPTLSPFLCKCGSKNSDVHHEVDGISGMCVPQSSRIPSFLDVCSDFPLQDPGGVAFGNKIGRRKGYH